MVTMRIICYLMLLLYLVIMERTKKYSEEDLEEEKVGWGVQVKPKAHNIPSSSLPQIPGATCTKIDNQVTYGVQNLMF